MARKRTKATKTATVEEIPAQNDGAESAGESEPSNHAANAAPTNTGGKVMGLTQEQIQALLGKVRVKGQYVVKLNEFVESGEGGISVKENWIEFRDKKDTTLKQGFDTAKDNKEAHEDAQFVKVVSSDGDVYLINLKIAGAAEGAELEEATA